MMIVYKTTNKINGKNYIGKDAKRMMNYLGSGVLLKRAIKKYGKENFEKEVVAWCDAKDKLNFIEKFYINFFKSKFPIGYNLTNGGDGGNTREGAHHSEETCRKISESNKGKRHSSETINRLINSHTGVHLSAEHSRRIGEGHKGLHWVWSEQSKKNLSETLKRRYLSVKHPMLGKTHSDEARKKMSMSRKGSIPWNKGMRRYNEI